MKTQMTIDLTGENESAVLEVTGEIDILTAPALDEALQSAREKGVFTVDLTGVTFIDSTGLRSLLQADAQPEGKLTLVVSEGPVTKLFRITGVDGVFDQVIKSGDRTGPS